MAASGDHLRGQVPGAGNVQATPSTASNQSQQQADLDPVVRFKLLIPRLKESLVNLMRISGQSLHKGSMAEEPQSTSDTQQKFEKALEEFYSVCDQVEVNLYALRNVFQRLALENTQQTGDLAKYMPFTVNIPNDEGKLPAQGNILQYPQYMALVKQQINCAKEVHDMLVECSRKISDKRVGV
ncbi:hypothetical protein FSP39_007293 [Pinctada imbricata]|uniref:Mediator of RNA polymerase II transcription subunit 29 n=1 Tax=Pinctada imbricata TaxID=66713 RepID=A0AA88Y2K2_PINIB|nr:hypothetical protein FSP39_007293 [Pinctada imbricata]